VHDIVEAEDSRVEAIMCLRKMGPHLLPHQLLDLNFQAAPGSSTISRPRRKKNDKASYFIKVKRELVNIKIGS